MNIITGLENKIQKFSKILNIILIISIIWYVIVTVIEGLLTFLPIQSDFIRLLVINSSGFIDSALTLIILMQLRIVIKGCENLTPFNLQSQNAFQKIVYLELGKFLNVLIFSLIIQEGVNFNFSYLIVAGVLLILVDIFKVANQDCRKVSISSNLIKWMNIGLLIRQIIWMISLVLLVLGSVAMVALPFNPANEAIMNEQWLVIQQSLPGVKSNLAVSHFNQIIWIFILNILVTAFSSIYAIVQVRKMIKLIVDKSSFDAVIIKVIKKIALLFIVVGILQIFLGFLAMNILMTSSLLALKSSLTFAPLLVGALVLLLSYVFEYEGNIKG